MATADLPLEDFTEGKVPPVCVMSGLAAENVFQFRFDGVAGSLPVNGSAIRSLRNLRLVVLGLAIASVGFFIFGMLGNSGTAPILAIGFLVIAVAMSLTVRKRIVTGRIVEDKLVLDRVHPAFAHAVSSGDFGTCSKCPSLADCPSRNPSECI